MARVLIITGDTKTLVLFRGDLMRAMVSAGHEVFSMAPETGCEEVLQEMGVSFVQIPLHRNNMNPLQDLVSIYSLNRAIRKIRPDVVLLANIKPVLYGAIASRIAGIPRIYSIITGVGYIFTGTSWKQKLLKPIICSLYRISLGVNERVFFQNPDDRSLFAELRLMTESEKAILINGSGVDTNKYFYTDSPKRPISFILIARLLWDKGIQEYVQAADCLKKRFPDVIFRILGPYDSNPRGIRPHHMATWVGSNTIEYMGETDDVRPFLADSTIFVLPSYREGTPRSVLEAMSMGRPIITTDVPGCRETVIDGVNGFIVSAKNSVALADAMEKFILDEKLILEMGMKGREIAVEKYDVHKVNFQILTVLGLISGERQ